MEVIIKDIPTNSTVTVTVTASHCNGNKSHTQTNQKHFKTTYAGSKVIEFVLDGVCYTVTSQNELKRLLLDSVKNKEHIPAWLRKGTSSNSTYRFILNNKSLFKKFSIVLRMADGMMRTISN